VTDIITEALAGHDGVPAPEAEPANAAASRQFPPPSSPMTVARVLAGDRMHDGELTIGHWRGTWMQWEHSRWTETEDRQVRAWLYRQLEHAGYLHLTAAGDRQVRAWAPNKRKIGDVADALAAITHLPERTDPPAWHGHGPQFAGPVVACANGLLDVTTRQVHPHTPRFFNLVSIPFGYDPDAAEPTRWLKFLAEIWPGDADCVLALQEIFGYVLSGRTDLQKIFLVIGPTRSGKGTIARILAGLVGAGNVAGPTLASLGTNFGLSPLIGKPLAVVSDARLDSRGACQVVERLLSISGEDVLTVDRKFKDPWIGKLPARFVILSNELPRLEDASGAIANRFIVLTMTASFLGREDTGLTASLLAELPGILNWSLDGLDRLTRRGRLNEPGSSADARLALQDSSSPVSAFIRDECRRSGEVRVDDLFTAWKAWCDENGHRPGTKQTLGRAVRAAVPGLRTSQPRDGGARDRCYLGLTLAWPRCQACGNPMTITEPGQVVHPTCEVS
jgi:putative DNA primase/helicase